MVEKILVNQTLKNMFIPQWLIDWFVETIQRWKMKRPKYFVYLSRIGDIAVMLTGLPYLFVQIEDHFGVTMPEFLTVLSSKLAFGIGLGISFASRLTVKSTVVAQTKEGDAVTVMDKTNLPLTEKSEAKEIANTEPPPKVMPQIPSPEDKSQAGDF